MIHGGGIFPARFLLVRLAGIGQIAVGISQEARFVVISKKRRHRGFQTVNAF